MVVNNRIWVVGAVIVMIAILALGFFLGAAPRFDEVAKNELQRQSVEQQNKVQEVALAGLKKDFENIAAYTAELATLQKAIPNYNDLSTFIGDLNALEKKSGVTLTNFGSSDAQPFVLDLGLPKAEEAPAGEEGEEGEATPAPEPEVPAVPAGTPVQTIQPSEFVVITVQLTVTGKQGAILNFVNNLQNGQRRYLVNSLNITIDSEGKLYTGVIEGYVYVLIDPRTPVDAEAPVEEPEEEEVDPSATPTPPVPTETPTP